MTSGQTVNNNRMSFCYMIFVLAFFFYQVSTGSPYILSSYTTTLSIITCAISYNYKILYISSIPAGQLSSVGTNQEAITSTLEQVITFYCKSRNVSYRGDNGMVELLSPLAALGFGKGDLFNCLYVLLTKYIAR